MGFIYYPDVCLIAMAVSQDTTEDREEKSRERMVSIAREMADSLAHDDSQISDSHPERDDIEGFAVENPVSPGIIYAKRGVTSDGWGYVWNRLHVTVSSSSIGTNGIMKLKRQYDLEVTDVWQSHKDQNRNFGQHDEPAITFSLEPRE